MEETIGYEALFSSDEWEAMDPPDDPEGGPGHPVTVWYPPGEVAGNDERHELECERCGYLGATEGLEEAEALARLHESFVATLVENWSVER